MRELDAAGFHAKDPAEGACKNFATNNEKANALLGDAFQGFELGRLAGAGSKSRFQESDGTPVDFAKRVVDELGIHHVMGGGCACPAAGSSLLVTMKKTCSPPPSAGTP